MTNERDAGSAASHFQRELEVVLETVRAGAELLRAEVQREGGPRGEGDKAPVDDEICALVVERLHAAFPRDAVISEELPDVPGESGRAFHVDPHDGTRHFLQGSRTTSISVGLVSEGQLRLGVVLAPLPDPLTGPHGLLVDWRQGGPLRRDEQPLEPRPPGPARDAIQVGDQVLRSPGMKPQIVAWNDRLLSPAISVGCGSIATRFALVAVGEALAGITLRNRLGSWDYCAGQALLEAAGGALVDACGERLPWVGSGPGDPEAREFIGARSPAAARELARRYLAAARERGIELGKR